MDTTLAKRYARALLTLGESDGQYSKYGEELSSFAGAFSQCPLAAQVLDSPVYTYELRSKILDSILAEAQLSPIVANFVHLLADRNRLGIISGIAESYGKLVDEKEGILRGVVTTPFDELSDSQFSAIREALGTFTGAKVILAYQKDPSLIGGVVARVGDLVLDGSLKTQLKKLNDSFS
ncbi:MAG: ATP synthase F1 subunit delta [Deltaproteobacteria bacterium]|jgi:F-type H+-transporting ATPase subunit delta|nr:ATP synthase F1 subunit delta [Deltaproteobacteria bacterium]